MLQNEYSPLKIGFVGAGMMGAAMIRGLVANRSCAKENVYFHDIDITRCGALRKELDLDRNATRDGCRRVERANAM